MIPFDFDYARPNTLAEAVRLLGRGGAKALAGGTDLVPNLRIAITRPATVVSLGGIAPQPIAVEADGALRIDALTRIAVLEHDEAVARRAPLLAAAAHTVAGNQIRQMGTLGGNLCQETRCLYLNQEHDFQFTAPCYKRGGACCYPFPRNDRDTCWSVYCSDIAPALIALAAEVEVLGPKGTRRLPVEGLFTGQGLRPLTLAQDELIGAAIVPAAGKNFGWGYHKTSPRGGLEFGMVIVAAGLRLADDGQTCAEARLVFGAIDEGPVRATAAEAALAGRTLDAETLAEIAKAAGQELSPLPHHGYTKSHIRDNIRVHLRRLLTQAVERARGSAV